MGSTISSSLLHDLSAKAEKASSGVWRPVGRSVAAGDKTIAEAVIFDRGTADEARANATHIAAASPANVLALVHELQRLRVEATALQDRIERCEAAREAAETELRRARATVAAVTFPGRPETMKHVEGLVQAISDQAPSCAAAARALGAIALARAAEDED